MLKKVLLLTLLMKPIVNQENILKRNLKKLKKMYKDSVEYEEFKKQKHAEHLSTMFKSVGNMSYEGENGNLS